MYYIILYSLFSKSNLDIYIETNGMTNNSIYVYSTLQPLTLPVALNGRHFFFASSNSLSSVPELNWYWINLFVNVNYWKIYLPWILAWHIKFSKNVIHNLNRDIIRLSLRMSVYFNKRFHAWLFRDFNCSNPLITSSIQTIVEWHIDDFNSFLVHVENVKQNFISTMKNNYHMLTRSSERRYLRKRRSRLIFK
jgi:hypothetical protein